MLSKISSYEKNNPIPFHPIILNHQFDGVAFVYNDVYADDSGRAIRFDRVQYYMSSLEIIHDGGQTTTLTDVYVLTNGNVSNYSLGNYNVNNIEGFNFNLGVDSVANHGNTSNYSTLHPLGPQTPKMDWDWPAGYFFLLLDGKVDNDGDGTPEKTFQMRAIGDMMLKEVDLTVSSTPTTGVINITLNVHVDKWIKNIDVAAVGIDHSSSLTNQSMCENTNTNQVFEPYQEPSTGISLPKKTSYITSDYSMTYAPVLNYSLSYKESYSLLITDINGKRIIEEEQIGFEGNYFILKELKSGVYFATFLCNSEVITHKFIVQR